MSSTNEIRENVARSNTEAEAEKRKRDQRRRLWLAVGKWLADHLVELAALILSIIALINTLRA